MKQYKLTLILDIEGENYEDILQKIKDMVSHMPELAKDKIKIQIE